jgi:uncharacterized protein
MDTRRSLLKKLMASAFAVSLNSKGGFVFGLGEKVGTSEIQSDKYRLKVNCGGPALSGFLSDQEYSPGSWGYTHGGLYFKCDAVSNDYGIPEVLRTLRYSCGAPFHYRFDVPNGQYNLKLYFVSPNELYDQRIFDVVLNGEIALPKFRPFPVNSAVLKELDAAVSNGQIDITFRSINDACLLNAIEVEQLSAVGSRKPAARTRRAGGDHQRVRHDDLSICYYGEWNAAKNSRISSVVGSSLDFTFKGSTFRWIGSKDVDHGIAEVYIDGVFQQTVDTYRATPSRQEVLYEHTGLTENGYHTFRLIVSKDKRPNSTGVSQDVSAFECEEVFDAAAHDADAAFKEVAIIEAGKKSYLAADEWRPVKNAAVAPEYGVTLQSGIFRTAFERNVAYQVDNWNMESTWTTWLPGANEGRRMAGAANILRWIDNPFLRSNLNSLVDSIAARQRADGYALPYPESDMGKLVYGANNERKPYDRRNFCLGLVAAGRENPAATLIARRFQDWLYSSSYVNTMLDGALGIMGDQPNLSVYFSAQGKPDDVIAQEKYWRQDWWLDQLQAKQPTAICRFPLNRAHSYVIAPWITYVDAYRATGDRRSIDAMLGAWRSYRDNFVHLAGSAAICEDCDNAYPPKSYHLNKHTGENCGGALWIDFNHRLLQLYPDQEQYAAEIEQTLYNVTLANQDVSGNLRYHTNLVGTKDAAKAICTCCEVTNTTILARLPEFLYSIADDGLYVNIYSSSSIEWEHEGRRVTMQTDADFPKATDVSMRLTLEAPTAIKIRLRIPSWATEDVFVSVNGVRVTSGAPGTYLTMARTWSNEDRVSFNIPIGFRLSKYIGFDRDRDYERYGLQYGPLLMSLVGGVHLNVMPQDLMGRLLQVPGSLATFEVEGHAGCKYVPYIQIQEETFTSYPTMV